MIEDNGGKNTGSISKKTSFILAGEGMGPSKREKAEILGIPIVTEKDFLAMIGEGEGEPVDEENVSSKPVIDDGPLFS